MTATATSTASTTTNMATTEETMTEQQVDATLEDTKENDGNIPLENEVLSEATATKVEMTNVNSDLAPQESSTDDDAAAVSSSTTTGNDIAVDPWDAVEEISNDGDDKEQKEKQPNARSFSERWESFRGRMQTKWKNSRTGSRNGSITNDASDVASGKAGAAEDDVQKMRAGQISVTLQKDTVDAKWGVGIQAAETAAKDPQKVQIAVMAGIGLLKHAPFQAGDILTFLNDQPCTNADDTIAQLLAYEAGVTITLKAETEGNQNIVQAMICKPSADADLGISFVTAEAEEKEEEEETDTTTTTTTSSTTTNGVEEEGEEKKNEENEMTKEVSTPPSDNEETPTNSTKESSASPKLLQIGKIEETGLFAKSVLSEGDYVVAINATPCSRLSAEEAQALLHQADDTVTIVALKVLPQSSSNNSGQPTRVQRWLRHAKRAGIALGGGTMVGVGLVFIPTLPPPFGEVLIIGGVSVLGTEFEAPKRVMKSARDSLEKAVGRKESTEDNNNNATKGEEQDKNDGTNVSESMDSDAAEKTAGSGGELDSQMVDVDVDASDEISANKTNNENDDSTPKRKTMKDRFKNFGRNVVLPFLDQVVGDRKEEQGHSHTQSPTNEKVVAPSTSPSDQILEEGATPSLVTDAAEGEPTKETESKVSPELEGDDKGQVPSAEVDEVESNQTTVSD